MEPEDYLNVVVTEWLPRRWEAEKYDRALEGLADRFARQHGDEWLHDVLAAKRSEGTTGGLAALSEALRANLADETEEALNKSSEAAHRLREAGNVPAALRADAEHIYALHWSAESSDECVNEAGAVLQRAQAARYLWILGQVLIDRGNCHAIVGDSGTAHIDMAHALELLRSVGYGDLELRAAGILADAETETGNLAASWAGSHVRLQQYWKRPHLGIRAQQIYFGLSSSASSLGLLETAYRFQNAAASAIAETSHRRIEANAWTYLARSAVAASHPLVAKAAFERADQTFNLLKPTPTMRRYRTLADLDRAEAEMDAGEGQAALQLLEEIQPLTSGLQAPHQLDFHGLMAEGLWRSGFPARAEGAYLRAIQFSEHSLNSLQEPRERAELMAAAARSYRGLVEILLNRGDWKGALSRWEWFRAGETPQRTADLDLERRMKRLFNESFLSYAVIRDHVMAWLFDDRGVTGLQLPVKRNDLEEVASRFLRECADPASDRQALNRDSRRLYDWLVAPLAEHLDPIRTLVIEPDGPVAAVPMQALMDEHSTYFGERFAVTIATGLVDYQRRSAVPPVDPDTSALVIANPSLAGDTAKTFPPLPGSMHEGEVVAGRFRRKVLIPGAKATVQALKDNRASAEILHFAGHGFSNGGNGGLLLSPAYGSSEEAGVLEGGAIARENWHHCRLAVLSACSAGTGEARGSVNPESLVRGFLWAGVARVLASRWNIEDQGGSFMDQFYKNLLSGNDAAGALREAARRVRDTKSTSHPYYWAGFQIFGTR